MIVVDRGELFGLAELVDYRLELLETVTPPFYRFEIFLELT
jgi:hypothetical protein